MMTHFSSRQGRSIGVLASHLVFITIVGSMSLCFGCNTRTVLNWFQGRASDEEAEVLLSDWEPVVELGRSSGIQSISLEYLDVLRDAPSGLTRVGEVMEISTEETISNQGVVLEIEIPQRIENGHENLLLLHKTSSGQ